MTAKEAETAVAPELITHRVTSGAVMVKQDMTLSQLGRTFAQSGFFKDAKDPAKCVVKIMAGQELGLSPIASMRSIHVFEGQIALSSGLMTALIKMSKRYRVRVDESNATVCSMTFTQLVDDEWEMCGPQITFTASEAEHLKNKDNWKYYKADMLYSRCLSRGFRRYCADLGMGTIYVLDELEEMVDKVEQVPAAQATPASKSLTDRLAALQSSQPVEPEPDAPEPAKPATGPGPVDAELTPGPVEQAPEHTVTEAAPAGAATAPEAQPEPPAEPERDQEPPAEPEDAEDAAEPSPAEEDTDEPDPAEQAALEAEALRATNYAAGVAMMKGALIGAIKEKEEEHGLVGDAATNDFRVKNSGHVDLAKLTKVELAKYYAVLMS